LCLEFKHTGKRCWHGSHASKEKLEDTHAADLLDVWDSPWLLDVMTILMHRQESWPVLLVCTLELTPL
jgi:hypothetical protein